MATLHTPIDAPARSGSDRSRLGTRLAYVATALTHLILVRQALGPDEGGFLVVAHHWSQAGPHLYGPLWVDRPPGLIALFSIASRLGPWGVRLSMIVLSVALVGLCASTARMVGGRAAAPWAAWTAYALGSSVLLQAEQLNGEYAAAVCVAASMLFILRALKSPTRWAPSRWALNAWAWSIASGAAAAAAVTMKQNFLDGFVFAGVLVSGTVLIGGASRRSAAPLAVGFAGGAGAVVALTLAWSRSRGGPGALFSALYTFRAHAAEVLSRGPLEGPDHRMWLLLALCLGSGLLVLAAHLVRHGFANLRSDTPLTWALAATAGFELFSLVAGANFWPHYALAFIPVLALAAGLAAQRTHPGWVGTQRIVAAMAVATAVVSPTAAVASGPGEAWTIGHWVRQSSGPGDSIVVTYTHPNVVAASGLRPGYPYLWSLPLRTLDPHLATLTATLDHPRGPTWVVVWDRPESWRLDRRRQLQRSLRDHYRLVAHVCHHPVWLRADVTRALAPVPADSACGGGAL